MKKYTFLIGLAATATIMSCSKVKNLTNIGADIPYNQTLVTPANIYDTTGGRQLPPGGLAVTFPQLAVPTSSQNYISQYNTSTDKIVSVSLKAATMNISAPANGNFNFLDSIAVYVSATGLPKVLLATKGNIPNNVSNIALDASNVDLKPYFLKDTMYLQTNAVFDSIPPSNTNINIDNTVHIVYNPLD